MYICISLGVNVIYFILSGGTKEMILPTHAVFEILILPHYGYMGGIISLNRIRRTLSF